jgi:hypothetical protein
MVTQCGNFRPCIYDFFNVDYSCHEKIILLLIRKDFNPIKTTNLRVDLTICTYHALDTGKSPDLEQIFRLRIIDARIFLEDEADYSLMFK